MGRISINGDDLHDTLLPDDPVNHDVGQENQDPLASRVWTETKKLWEIVGPAIFSRVATFSMNIITQAFAGHLGDVELAAISIANTVIVGFNFGLLVCYWKFFFQSRTFSFLLSKLLKVVLKKNS